MKYFVDTAEVEEIKNLLATELLNGVTTNPSMVANSGRNFKEVAAEIGTLTDAPVSSEIAPLDSADMIEMPGTIPVGG